MTKSKRQRRFERRLAERRFKQAVAERVEQELAAETEPEIVVEDGKIDARTVLRLFPAADEMQEDAA